MAGLIKGKIELPIIGKVTVQEALAIAKSLSGFFGGKGGGVAQFQQQAPAQSTYNQPLR
jgi:hypothetical protein